MIVVLSYYSDGSGKPSLRFFNSGETNDLIRHLAQEGDLAKALEIFDVGDENYSQIYRMEMIHEGV